LQGNGLTRAGCPGDQAMPVGHPGVKKDLPALFVATKNDLMKISHLLRLL
jgi:hypothetical protein